MRRLLLRYAVAALVLLLVGLAGWWTWPSRWGPGPRPEPIEVHDRRPAWARSLRPPLGLPPVSREARRVPARPKPVADAGPLPVDPDDFEDGLAAIGGWVVDHGGRPLSVALVTLRCEGDAGPTARLAKSVDADGWFEFLVPAPSWCTVRASRQDGALRALSQTETYLLDDDDYLEVDLVLPSDPIGGVGISIGDHALGVEVLYVLPGSPAEQVGLERGDVVTAVDGVPVSGSDLDDFIRRGTGEAGTEVSFEVVPGGDLWAEPVLVQTTRAFIEEEPRR